MIDHTQPLPYYQFPAEDPEGTAGSIPRCLLCGVEQDVGEDHHPDCLVGLYEHAGLSTSYERLYFDRDNYTCWATETLDPVTPEENSARFLGVALAECLSKGAPEGRDGHRCLGGSEPEGTITMALPATLTRALREGFMRAKGYLPEVNAARDRVKQAEDAEYTARRNLANAEDAFTRILPELSPLGIERRKEPIRALQHDLEVRGRELKAARETLEALLKRVREEAPHA